ncbi:MAG: hypothetical protein AB8D52_07375 [Gammaproteobacteria bacterium]
MRALKTTESCYCLYGFAVLLALIILLIVYPGFMSYDSLHALREARGQVEGGSYPPYVSYVWRFFDSIWPGPSLMILIQNSLLLLSLAHILRLSGMGSHWSSYIFLILFAACAPLLGSMVVAWKDVAVGSCFIVVVSIIMQMQQTRDGLKKNSLFLIGCFFLFSGMAYRFNAASGALPLFFVLYWVLFGDQLAYANIKKKITHITYGLTIFAMLFSLVHVMNTYRLPSFEPFKPNVGFAVIASYDLIGISKFEGQLVFKESLKDQELIPSPKLLNDIYEPKHLNLTMQKYTQMDPDGRKAIFNFKEGISVFDLWIDSVKNYPLSYFAHRIEIAKNLAGFNKGPQFYPTHYHVDPNEYEITLIPNELNKALVEYVIYGVDELKIRPWTIYFMMILLVPFFIYFSSNKLLVISLSASSILYFIPMIFLLPAADLRYNFWSLVSAIVCIIIGLVNLPFIQKYVERRNAKI